MKESEYGLHVFIESLYNDILESYSKNIQKNYVLYSPSFCPNTGAPMYNLTEYSDNYSDTSGGLCQFKKDEIVNDTNVTVANSSSLKCKSNVVGNTIIMEI